MTYSCSDFTDTILDALGIDVPPESADSPSDQADLCLAEIKRLHRIEIAAKAVFTSVTEQRPDVECAVALAALGKTLG